MGRGGGGAAGGAGSENTANPHHDCINHRCCVCVEVLIACMRLLQGYTHAVMIQNQDENRNVSVNYNILSSTPTTKHNIFGLCRTEFDLF